MRYRKNIFTGENEWVDDSPAAEFEVLNERARERVAYMTSPRTNCNPWYKEKMSLAMSLKPEDATPEAIERENAEAKRRGTGAYYNKNGECFLPTRGSRRKEMRRRRLQDNDGCYGD